MENEKFGLDTLVGGKSINEWLAALAEKNDNLSIEIERVKADVAISKQINNNSRLQLDAAKYALKKLEFETKQGKVAATEPA